MLCVIETHPIQYHAPVWRAVQRDHGISVTAIYGSDFSVAGYRDREFGATFRWDTDLLSGYTPKFLSRVGDGGAADAESVTTRGLGAVLQAGGFRAALSVGYSPRFHAEGFRCARRAGLPVLFRGETTDHARVRGWLKRTARDAGLRWLYARCAALLHVGRHSLAHFRRLGFTGRDEFFSPYCVDPAPFRTDETARGELRSATRRALGFTDEQRVIMFCGKLSLRKGPDLLLAALRLLPESLRGNCALLLVGDGELREELMVQAARVPAIPVQCVGFQAQGALSQFYHAADLFVLPSRHGETWGLVVNEALHHGVPVVVTEAVGCAPDLVESGRTGEVCSADSTEALAAAMLKVGPLMGEDVVRTACRAHVAGYSISRAAAGIAAAYRQVVAIPANEAGR